MPDYTLTTINVNKKSLLNEISVFIEDIINEYNVIWDNDIQRDTILEVIDMFMDDLTTEHKITQFDVICDSRNNSNKTATMIFLDVQYKQKNCYNITQLKYAIIKK